MNSAALNTLTSDTSLVGALLVHHSKDPRQQATLLSHCKNIDGQKLTGKNTRIGLYDQLSIIGHMGNLKGPFWALDAPDFWDHATNNIFCDAIRSAPTLADSLDIFARYGFLWSQALYFEKFETSRHTILTIETISLPDADPIIQTGLKSLRRLALIAVYRLLNDFLQGAWHKTHIWSPENKDVMRRFSAFSASPLIHEKSRIAVQLPAELRLTTTANSDPVKFRKTSLQLESLVNPTQKTRSTMEIVSAVLDASQNHRPALAEVSKSMGMSARTLNRRLAADGTSFRRLLDASLKKRTIIYLSQGNMSRGEISERLGYKDQASFSRSLQRWKLG